MADVTSHKAWAATGAAIVIPYVLQNLSGASDSAGMVFDWAICGHLGSLCPDPNDVAKGFKSIASAIFGGVLTGLITYVVSNKPKYDVIIPKLD